MFILTQLLIQSLCAVPQACIDGSIEVVSFLLSQGANVNQVDNEGWTPLHVAASCGNMEIAEYVLCTVRHGAEHLLVFNDDYYFWLPWLTSMNITAVF